MSYVGYKVKDNAQGQLLSSLSSEATGLTLLNGEGANFPSLSEGEEFLATLVQFDGSGFAEANVVKRERICVTGISGDTLTIIRGDEGDTPQTFEANDYLFLTVRAKNVQELQDEVERLEREKVSIDDLGVVPVGDVVGTTDEQTLSNKRIIKRVVSITPNATPTIDTDECDVALIDGLNTNVSNMSTNLGGTPTDGQILIISIIDNGTPREIVRGSNFEGTDGVPLPTTTIANIRLDVFFMYDDENNIWRCVGSTASSATSKIGGDGSDGNLSISSGTTTITTGVKNYNNLTISGTAVLTSTTPITYIRVKGDFTMSAGTIHANGLGANGGIISVNGEKGGTIYSTNSPSSPAGGNGTSDNTGGTGGEPGSGIRSEQIKLALTGGGGGGAYTGGTGTEGNEEGRKGGGILIIEVGGTINFSGGVISANGENGITGTKPGGGGGGGGSVVILYHKSTTISGTIQANGGNGCSANNGTPNSSGGGGGGGGGAGGAGGDGGKGGNPSADGSAGGSGIVIGGVGTANGGSGGTRNNVSGKYRGGGGGGGGGFIYVGQM